VETLRNTGISKAFLNKTAIVQKIRARMDKSKSGATCQSRSFLYLTLNEKNQVNKREDIFARETEKSTKNCERGQEAENHGGKER
jgi:hypothetical protein